MGSIFLLCSKYLLLFEFMRDNVDVDKFDLSSQKPSPSGRRCHKVTDEGAEVDILQCPIEIKRNPFGGLPRRDKKAVASRNDVY